jgi:hypothetical protein
MIELTKARLEHARTLLGKLKAEKFKQVQNATSTASLEFLWLIYDFITTARSVSWVLQSEEKKKYDAWQCSPGAMVSPAEETIFRRVTKMRNSIEKRGHARIEARREWVEIPENPHPVAGSHYSGLPQWGRPKAKIDVYYVKGTNLEVVSLCEQYLDILTRLIDDFEQNAQAGGGPPALGTRVRYWFRECFVSALAFWCLGAQAVKRAVGRLQG